MEGSGFKSKTQNMFKGTQSAWNKFLKPAVNVAAPYWYGCWSQNKNPQVAEATTIFFEGYMRRKDFEFRRYAWKWFTCYVLFFKYFFNKMGQIKKSNN